MSGERIETPFGAFHVDDEHQDIAPIVNPNTNLFTILVVVMATFGILLLGVVF